MISPIRATSPFCFSTWLSVPDSGAANSTVELAAPESGTLSQVLKQKGEVARIGEIIGYLETNGPARPETEKPKAQSPGPKAQPSLDVKPAEPRVMPAAQM